MKCQPVSRISVIIYMEKYIHERNTIKYIQVYDILYKTIMLLKSLVAGTVATM